MTACGRTAARIAIAVMVAAAAACGDPGRDHELATDASDPPAVALGERLFLETRFAEHARAELLRDGVNASLAHRDPILDETVTTGDPFPGPFKGGAMSCRACHLVDEHGSDGGNRTYADFARRSPIPARGDGLATTPRNSPPLVDATDDRSGAFFLHFDGEFTSTAALARGTLIGRNFGWLPDEQPTAIAWIARVIREDDGRGALASEFASLPYSVVLAGSDPAIPPTLRLPDELRIDVTTASDDAVVDAVAAVIAAYVDSLRFARDVDGLFVGSPYDRFLTKNGLPRAPEAGESDLDYSRRLRDAVERLTNPRFVSRADGELATHHHDFVFDARELAGLRVFLAEPARRPLTDDAIATGGVGNCIACHPAPVFTDFAFHNTGAAQEEYDAIHGSDAFAALDVPDLATRTADPERYLPPSPAHPAARGTFRDVPSLGRPGVTDLGLWNVLANDAMPAAQPALAAMLCAGVSDCAAAALLPTTIARFKTPSLRDLGQSGPYMHTGQKDTLDDVLAFYGRFSDLARAERVRNADAELAALALTEDDRGALAAFLRALDEDYE